MGRVLSGKYVGYWAAENNGYLMLGNSEKIDSTKYTTYVTKHKCKSYEYLGEKYDGPNVAGAVTGALIAGTAGAVIGAAGGSNSHHIKVVWNDGSESLMTLTYKEYMALVAGMQTSMSSNEFYKQERKTYESDKNFETGFKIFGIVAAIIYVLYYIIAGAKY